MCDMSREQNEEYVSREMKASADRQTARNMKRNR